jgi:hypothetical protein
VSGTRQIVMRVLARLGYAFLGHPGAATREQWFLCVWSRCTSRRSSRA